MLRKRLRRGEVAKSAKCSWWTQRRPPHFVSHLFQGPLATASLSPLDKHANNSPPNQTGEGVHVGLDRQKVHHGYGLGGNGSGGGAGRCKVVLMHESLGGEGANNPGGCGGN